MVWWREIRHLDGREERAALICLGGLFTRTTESVPLHSMAYIWPVPNLDPVTQCLETSLVPLRSSARPSSGGATLRGILHIRILRLTWPLKCLLRDVGRTGHAVLTGSCHRMRFGRPWSWAKALDRLSPQGSLNVPVTFSGSSPLTQSSNASGHPFFNCSTNLFGCLIYQKPLGWEGMTTWDAVF
jgi:hypothetical protein